MNEWEIVNVKITTLSLAFTLAKTTTTTTTLKYTIEL